MRSNAGSNAFCARTSASPQIVFVQINSQQLHLPGHPILTLRYPHKNSTQKNYSEDYFLLSRMAAPAKYWTSREGKLNYFPLHHETRVTPADIEKVSQQMSWENGFHVPS